MRYRELLDPPIPVPCQVHRYHSPEPHRTIHHHIVPLSWHGPDLPSNRLIVCDTGHYSIHVLIDAYVRAGGDPGWAVRRRWSRTDRDLAARAWAGRPSDTPPLTLPQV